MAKPAALEGLPDPFAKLEPTGEPVTAPQTMHELQAVGEGVPSGNEIQFMGQTYRIADKVGHIPYMRFCRAVRHGLNFEDFEGMSAIMDMLEDCFVVAHACEECTECKAGQVCPTEDLGDWPRFDRDATRKKAEAEPLLEVITQAIQRMSARPTQRPSDSSAGPSTTSPSSTGSSSSPAIQVGQEKLYMVEDLIKQAGA